MTTPNPAMANATAAWYNAVCSGQAAVSTSVSSVDSSGFSVTVSSEPGNPLLLGVIVEPASSYI